VRQTPRGPSGWLHPDGPGFGSMRRC